MGSIRNALDILNSCIENGKDVLKFCNETPETIRSNPKISQFISKINEETNSIERLKKKISDLIETRSQDFTKCKTDLISMVSSMDSLSVDDFNYITKAVANSKISKVKRKIEENEKSVKNFQGDDVSKNFLKILIERNQKIVNCLNHVSKLLSKTSFDDTDATINRQLFIYGEDLQRTMVDRNQNKHRIGSVTIQGGGEGFQSSTINTTTNRQSFRGFLKENSGNVTEVILELKQQLGHDITTQSITNQVPKLSATLAIEGEIEQNVEVFEVTVNDIPPEQVGPTVIAVIQNENTGNIEQVPMQMLPLTPRPNVHGQILQLQTPTTEQLADISLNLVENSAIDNTQFNRTPIFLTPPKTPAGPSRKVTKSPRRNIQKRALEISEEELDDIEMDLVENSAQQFPNASQLTNEQISKITMDLIDDFINDSIENPRTLPTVSPTRKIPHFATPKRASVKSKEKNFHLGTPSRATRKAQLPRGLDIAFDTAADVLATSIINQERSERLEDLQLSLIGDESSYIDHDGSNIPDHTPIFLTPPKTPKAPSRRKEKARSSQRQPTTRELNFGEELLDDMNLTLAENSIHNSMRLPTNLTRENLEDMDITFVPSIYEADDPSTRHVSFRSNLPSTSPTASSIYATPSRRGERIKDRSLHYGTPSRFPRKVQLKKYQTKVSQPQIPQDEEHISQFNLDLVDMVTPPPSPVVRSRTPIQLTPPRTPQAPRRILQQQRHLTIPNRQLDVTEEDLANIEMDLVDNSAVGFNFPIDRTQDQISQINIELAPNFDESSILPNESRRVPFNLPPTSPNARTIYGTPKRNQDPLRNETFHYGTPSRFPRKAQLRRNLSPIRSIIPPSRLVAPLENEENLSQMEMDLVENESPMKITNTPIQLTPQRTPLAPNRLNQRLPRGGQQLIRRPLDITEEQIDNIDLDLVDNSAHGGFPQFLIDDTQEHISQVDIDFAPELNDSFGLESLTTPNRSIRDDSVFFGRPNQSSVGRRFDNSDLLQFSSNNSDLMQFSRNNSRVLGNTSIVPRIEITPTEAPRRLNRSRQQPKNNFLSVSNALSKSVTFNQRRMPPPRAPHNTSLPTRLILAPPAPIQLDRSLNVEWQSAQMGKQNETDLADITEPDFFDSMIDDEISLTNIQRSGMLPYLAPEEFAPRYIQNDERLDDMELDLVNLTLDE